MIRTLNIPSANTTLYPDTKHTRRLESALLLVLILSLFARTIAYNYDFSQSLKDNAPNYSQNYVPLKRQPIKTQKPRALANITIPMAQETSDLKQNSPLTDTFLFAPHNGNPSSTSPCTLEYAAFLALAPSSPPDICVLNAIFRI